MNITDRQLYLIFTLIVTVTVMWWVWENMIQTEGVSHVCVVSETGAGSGIN